MTHGDAGLRCLAGHYEGDYRDPKILPPCIKCKCGEWVRPENWADHIAGQKEGKP